MEWGEFVHTLVISTFAICFYELLGWLKVRKIRWSCPDCTFRVTTDDTGLRNYVAHEHRLSEHSKR